MLKTQDFFTSKRALAGLGLWNVYFIAKFVLLSQGYLHFKKSIKSTLPKALK